MTCNGHPCKIWRTGGCPCGRRYLSDSHFYPYQSQSTDSGPDGRGLRPWGVRVVSAAPREWLCALPRENRRSGRCGATVAFRCTVRRQPPPLLWQFATLRWRYHQPHGQRGRLNVPLDATEAAAGHFSGIERHSSSPAARRHRVQERVIPETCAAEDVSAQADASEW